jgi:diguanylate cyclase (GGDEF)-like protein
VAVLFLDLDGFKSINDTVGHAAGDRILQQVADRLSTVLRPHDVLGRLSGDEFVVICEGLTYEHPVAAIAERLGGALRSPLQLDAEQFLVTVSIGIALAEGSEDPTSLIDQADAAMYRSKELGRARFEVFSDALRDRITKRLDLERSMRRAVEREELRLHYQPEVDLRTGAVVGLEALLRWERASGMVMPMDFIPLAEETGLIVPLGAWALDAAVQQAHAWDIDADVCAEPWMSVNLSVRQLSDPSLVQDVVSALSRSGCGPEKLCLEVTESLVVEDPVAGLAVLAGLKALGTEIAIDDFGTGYASLSYLRQFPASILKIDQSFVARITEEPRTRAIVSAVIGVAHALGLKAVAEGVETAEQLAIVHDLGCDIGQGYYFARPAPADAVRELLTRPFAFAELVPSAGGKVPAHPASA